MHDKQSQGPMEYPQQRISHFDRYRRPIAAGYDQIANGAHCGAITIGQRS
jgi:hypothetical protein